MKSYFSKYLVLALIASTALVACSKKSGGGDGGGGSPAPVVPIVPTATAGFDNSYGRPAQQSIRGIPIANFSAALIDNDFKSSGYYWRVDFYFDGSGLLRANLEYDVSMFEARRNERSGASCRRADRSCNVQINVGGRLNSYAQAGSYNNGYSQPQVSGLPYSQQIPYNTRVSLVANNIPYAYDPNNGDLIIGKFVASSANPSSYSQIPTYNQYNQQPGYQQPYPQYPQPTNTQATVALGVSGAGGQIRIRDNGNLVGQGKITVTIGEALTSGNIGIFRPVPNKKEQIIYKPALLPQ